MNRVTIRPLAVWETPISHPTVLPAGIVLTQCQVVRTSDEPYVVRFDCDGGSYWCPLYAFQPRTEALEAMEAMDAAVQPIPAAAGF